MAALALVVRLVVDHRVHSKCRFSCSRAAAALEGLVSKVLPPFGELRSKRERVKRVACGPGPASKCSASAGRLVAVVFGASAVVRYYKARVEASVSVRHIRWRLKMSHGLRR